MELSALVVNALVTLLVIGVVEILTWVITWIIANYATTMDARIKVFITTVIWVVGAILALLVLINAFSGSPVIRFTEAVPIYYLA